MNSFKWYPKRLAVLTIAITGIYLLYSYIDPATHIDRNEEAEKILNGEAQKEYEIEKERDKEYKQYYDSLSEEEKYEKDHPTYKEFEISNDINDIYEPREIGISVEKE